MSAIVILKEVLFEMEENVYSLKVIEEDYKLNVLSEIKGFEI